MNRYLCSICLVAIGCGLGFFAVLSGQTAPPVSDLLILRSGAIEKGEFKSYSNDRCQLGEKSFARDQIAWIGFSAASATPPAITDSTHDEVHLRNGTVQTGRLVSASLTQVVTERNSYNRSDVAWIHLAVGSGGDWNGSLDWSIHNTVPTGPQDWSGHADLILNDDDHGGLTGTLAGTETQTLAIAGCHGTTTWTVNARLIGTVDPSAKKITIEVVDRKSTRPENASCGPCITGIDIFRYPNFAEGFRSLASSSDGSSYQYHHEFPVAGGTGQFTLIVRKVQNKK